MIEGGALSSEDVEFMGGVLHEILENDEVTGPLHEEFPGLRVLGIMNLKFEISIPGTVIESTADAIGDGLVAWERSVWSAINHPIEFRVVARIED